jgi:phenylalanyl-tRNA synthetase beta chain
VSTSEEKSTKAALPEERLRLAGVITESARTKGYWKSKSPRADFYSVKSVLQSLFERLHVRDVEFTSRSARGWIETTSTFLRSGQETLGSMGEIEPSALVPFGIEEKVFAFELSLNAVFLTSCGTPVYSPVPRFPSIRRDLAMVVDEDVRAGDIQATIRENGRPLLQSSELFDVYQGKRSPQAGKVWRFRSFFLAGTHA